MLTTHQTAVRDYLKVSLMGAGAVMLVGLPLAAAGAVLAFALGYDPALVAGALIFGAALVGALFVVDGLRVTRWAVVETIAAALDRQHAETERERAQAHRIEAEAEAITGANTVISQNITAGDGATIKAPVKAPRVTVMGKQVSWSQVNQITPAQPEPRRIEIPREDVLWMLEQFTRAGHSRRVFEGANLPYSQLPAYPDPYRALIGALVEGAALVGRGERATGRLVVKDLGQLAKIVDTAYPRGVVLELPATAGAAGQESGKAA